MAAINPLADLGVKLNDLHMVRQPAQFFTFKPSSYVPDDFIDEQSPGPRTNDPTPSMMLTVIPINPQLANMTPQM
jgi:hypothetical protein